MFHFFLLKLYVYSTVFYTQTENVQSTQLNWFAFLPGGKGRQARKADNLTAICEPIV
jgi:hypothetical protein